MFKNYAVIENFYDREYKFLHETLLKRYDALSEAIHAYRIKEIKVRLFPKNTISYNVAVEGLKAAQLNIWTCKSDYRVALMQVQDYYAKNHEHFVACKGYADPNEDNCTVDEVIERIIDREF